MFLALFVKASKWKQPCVRQQNAYEIQVNICIYKKEVS